MSSGREPLRVTEPGPASGPIRFFAACWPHREQLQAAGTERPLPQHALSALTGGDPLKQCLYTNPAFSQLLLSGLLSQPQATDPIPKLDGQPRMLPSEPRAVTFLAGSWPVSKPMCACFFPYKLGTAEYNLEDDDEHMALYPVSGWGYFHIIPFYPQKKNPVL